MTLHLNDILDCAGWRWKASALLLLAAPFATLLPHPSALLLSLGMMALSAILALLASATLIRQALDPAAIMPAEESDPFITLRAVLESQNSQMHEAAAAVSRAVTAGAQLTQLTRQAEQHWRSLLEPAQPAPHAAARPAALLEELRAAILLAREEDTAARQAAESTLQRQLESMSHRLEALAATAASGRSAPNPAPQDSLSASLQALEDLSGQLAGQVHQTAHQQASLGDAARYLTEIAERLRDGSQAVDTHAVRLQAMISLAGQKQEEAASRQAVLVDRLRTMVGQHPLVDPVPALLQNVAAPLGRPITPAVPTTAPENF